MAEAYTVHVKSRFFWKKFKVIGHTYANTVSVPVEDEKGRRVVQLVPGETTRLELWHPDGKGVTIFGDLAKLQVRLGADWHAKQERQQAAEAGNVAALIKK